MSKIKYTDQAGTEIEGTASAPASRIEYKTQTVTPQCKIICYLWKNRGEDNDFSDSQLAQTERLDISSQLLGCSFSKTMGKPDGTFKFTLSNSPGIDSATADRGVVAGSGDWKDILKRGMWCVIYMSQEGELNINPRVGSASFSGSSSRLPAPEAKKIRCIGFIDRVAVKSSLNDRGAFDITYEVTGRDFGVIYSDTTIWHNMFLHEKIILKDVVGSKLNVFADTTIDAVVDVVHDLFFFPENLEGVVAQENRSLLDIALQWILPNEMVSDLNFGTVTDTFWGGLRDVKKFSPTLATLSVSKPTDYLSGNAWDNLKRISVPELHELFTETNDEGNPELIFRPIPFGVDKGEYPTVGEHITLYKDLEQVVEIPALDVIDFSIGEDNHNRYNSFLLTVDTSLINPQDNISLLEGSGFPKNIQNSIKRYGFRPMHVTAHAIVKNAERGGGEGNDTLIREFNHVLEDYWRPAVFSESGSVKVIGNNKIKVGKALTFGENTPYLVDKRFYIEGYTDTFTVGRRGEMSWETTVYLTRGFSDADLQNLSFSDRREESFNTEGEFSPAGGR